MSIWDILGIEKTQDTAAIRRAYAAKAAKCSPEDDPDGFMQLRQAYEQAMALAKGRQGAPQPVSPQPMARPDKVEPPGGGQNEAAPPPEPQPIRGGFSLDLDESADTSPFLQHPAMEEFRALYCSTQRRERKKWDLYFTSPEFLSIWREPAFTAALEQTVANLEGEFPPSKEFQTALAAAYRYRAIVYKDHTEFELAQGAGFEGLRDILSIAVRGPLVRKLQGNDIVLSAGYADYAALCSMAPDGVWTDAALTALDTLLGRYCAAYLKEKCSGDPATERNVLSLRLLNHFFYSTALPPAVYEMLWNEFDLNSAILGRAKVLYGRLREICLGKAPEVCGQRENFSALVRAYDAHVACLINNDQEEIQRRVEEFFAREDLQRAVRSRSFVENHTFWAGNSSGQVFLERLIALYEQQPDLPLAQRMKEDARDTLRVLARDQRREAERDRLIQLAQMELTGASCTLSNPLFLRYFLHTAFFRAETEDRAPLSQLLTEELPCMSEWNRQLAQQGLVRSFSLTRSEERPMTEGGQTEPVSVTIDFEVVFHQFYVEHRCNGEAVHQPVLPFWGLDGAPDDELFLLLPIMAAYQEERDQIGAQLKERLARLDVPEEIVPTLADALAGEVACLVQAEGGVVITRPVMIARENEGMLCFCEWYGNGRLITLRRTGGGIQLLQEYCRDGLTGPDSAIACAEGILDEIFAPERALTLTGAGPAFAVIEDYFRSHGDTPPKICCSHQIDLQQFQKLLHDFEEKQISQLVFTLGRLVDISDPRDAEAAPNLEFQGNDHAVLLWDSADPAESKFCALLRFDDIAQHWDALISDRELYLRADAKTIPKIPFRMGFLKAFAVHHTPKKAIAALLGLLNGEPEDSAQWARTTYLNNAMHSYYVSKRTVGGFPIKKRDVTWMLRNKYVLAKTPVRLTGQTSDGSMDEQEITMYNRGRVADQLARFEMGKLDRLVLTWSFEECGIVHLVLLHEETEGRHRYQAAVIQDGDHQTIDYLVGNRQEYMDADERRKPPADQFQGSVIPRYLIHYDFLRMRDFLDLFFMSLPDFSPILSPFGEFASGPQKLVKKGFDAHRDALLGGQR